MASDELRHGPDELPHALGRTVVGVFDRLEDAEAAARDLQAAECGYEHVSIVTQPAGGPRELGAEETRAGRGAVAGASAGAILGGALSLTALAIPGAGPLLAAGPIVTVLSGALVGGAVGGLAGSFVGLGVPKEHAHAYEAAVRAGGVVLSVALPDQKAADCAHRVLAEHGARELERFQPAL
jgi:hypothetical protein